MLQVNRYSSAHGVFVVGHTFKHVAAMSQRRKTIERAG